MASKALGNNPLFKKSEPTTEQVFTAEEVAQIEDIEEFETMSFRVRRGYIKLLRDYAYTNRLEIKEALDEILTGFFENIDKSTLLESPDKPKKSRKKA